MSSSVALLFRSLFAVRGGLGVAAIAMVLAGCSGSHSEPPGGGDGSGPTDAPTVALSVVDQATGLVKNTISSTSPSVARAVVKDGSGQAVENSVVSFASSDSAAVIFSPAATALTDSSGMASVTVAPASLSTARGLHAHRVDAGR